MQMNHDPACPRYNDPYNVQIPCICLTTAMSPPQPSGKGKLNLKKWLARGTLALTALLIATTGLFVFLPDFRTDTCIKTPASFMCSNGIGIQKMSIDKEQFNIGIIDETLPYSFHLDGEETNIVNKIFAENKKAKQQNYATIVVPTTLSTSTGDPTLSRSVGLEELRGAYVAQHMYNNTDPSRKIRLVVGNLGVKVKSVIQNTAPHVVRQVALYAKKAPKEDNVLGMAGFPFSAASEPALPLVKQYGIPFVSSSSSSDDFTAGYLPEFHRIISANNQQNPFLLKFIRDELYAKNVHVITNLNDSYTETLGETMVRDLELAGIRLKHHLYHNASEFDNILDEIERDNPDLVFLAAFPDDLIILKEKMKAKYLSTPIMGGQALYEVGAYVDKDGNPYDTYSKVFFSAFVYPDAEAQGTREFQDNYGEILDPEKRCRDKYGCGRMTPHAAFGHDAILAFIDALHRISGDITPETVKGALVNVSFDGATGHTEFNGVNSNPGNKPIYILCADADKLTQMVVKYYPDKDSDYFVSPGKCL